MKVRVLLIPTVRQNFIGSVTIDLLRLLGKFLKEINLTVNNLKINEFKPAWHTGRQSENITLLDYDLMEKEQLL